MVIVPESATDAEIIAAVEGWLRLLEREDYDAAAAEISFTVRQAIAVITSAKPDMKRLMPMSRPRAQAALPGQPAMMIPARTKSATPLIAIQGHERANRGARATSGSARRRGPRRRRPERWSACA